MKKCLIQFLTCCAALATLAVQGQTSQDSSSPRNAGAGTSSDSFGQSRSRYGATGRMGQHEVRGSKLTGADVKTSQGESIGKIEDIVINSGSGRVDFAVVAYNSSGTSSSSGTSPSSTSPSSTSSTSPSSTTSSTSSSTASTSSTSSSSGEKLIPIPFTMLRPQGMTGYGSSSSTSSTSSTSTSSSGSEEQPTFVFTGDKSRLDNAPSFDRSSWPDLTQTDWRQRIYAHFGMQSGSSTGGATTPGGTSSGTSTDSSSQSTPDSSSSSTPKR